MWCAVRDQIIFHTCTKGYLRFKLNLAVDGKISILRNYLEILKKNRNFQKYN